MRAACTYGHLKLIIYTTNKAVMKSEIVTYGAPCRAQVIVLRLDKAQSGGNWTRVLYALNERMSEL
jgi:hypothetical protein